MAAGKVVPVNITLVVLASPMVDGVVISSHVLTGLIGVAAGMACELSDGKTMLNVGAAGALVEARPTDASATEAAVPSGSAVASAAAEWVTVVGRYE